MFNKKPSQEFKLLTDLLASNSLREEVLGVKNTRVPTPEQMLNDTANLINYTNQPEYQVFAKEAWAHVLLDLDTILDPKSTNDQVNTARGAMRATLDLLRKSYQAKQTYEALKGTHQNVPSAR